MNQPKIDLKITAIIAYATIVGTIIAIFMNLERQNAFARFHIRQAFGIFVLFYLLGLWFPILIVG